MLRQQLYESTEDSRQRQLRDLKEVISVGEGLKQFKRWRRVEAMQRLVTHALGNALSVEQVIVVDSYFFTCI